MISVVIPVINLHDMTAECIAVICKNTRNCEIIVIDNGSEPPFKTPFTGFTEISIIRNEKNEGFPVAVNQGIKAARGDIIILLNNDCFVTPGWDEKLVRALNDFSIVGPVTNYCRGMQRVQAAVYEDMDGLNRIAADWAENYGDEIQEVNFLIGFCMAFRKSLVDEIGYFDESLWPCSGEEVDFCYRAKEAGHMIGIVKGCYVHHEGSVSFADMEKDGQLDYADICRRNDKYLENKWGKNYWQLQAITTNSLAQGLCLNLGCGRRKLEGFINIDNRAEVDPDVVCDVTCRIPYKDNSIDLIQADDFLEHVPQNKVIFVMEEIWRVLKPGGVFKSSTPDAEHGQGAFQDPHHVSFWVENSWLYYSDAVHRELYGIKADFAIENIERIMNPGNARIFHLHVTARARK
jgi:GT2 family glycosyltransferase